MRGNDHKLPSAPSTLRPPPYILRLVDKDGDGKFNSEGETLVWLEGTPPLERVHALDL